MTDLRKVVAVGLGFGLLLASAPQVDAFGFGALNRFKKVRRSMDKVNDAKRKIAKARKMFACLSGGMKGIRAQLQKRILGSKRVSRVLNKYMAKKELFRKAWDGEVGTGDKHKFLKKLLKNRKALAALKRGNFQQAFAKAKVKLPSLLQSIATGEATSLAGALKLTAMKKLVAKGIAPGFLKSLRGGLNLNSLSYFALRKNKKFGSAFQNMYEEEGGGFRQVLQGLGARERNKLIRGLSKDGSAMSKFTSGKWAPALQMIGVKVPTLPGVPAEGAEGEVAETECDPEEGAADEYADDEGADDEGDYEDTGDSDYEDADEGDAEEGDYDETGDSDYE